MNYRSKIKALIEQVSGTDRQFHQTCKPQNRKVFPFYCRASLCSYKYVNGVPVVQDRMKYDDNPEDASNETCYWGWVVFEDVRIVKFYEDFPKKYYPKLYAYSEQIHGWTEPINFDKTFECSIKHRAVWYIALASSCIRYYLNDYKNTGITTKIYSDHVKEALHGGAHPGVLIQIKVGLNIQVVEG